MAASIKVRSFGGVVWGGFAPPEPPLKRSFVTFDRGGQTGPPRSNDFFFGAADDMRATRTSGRTSGRTPGRTPADDTGAADDRPPTRSTTSRHRRKLRTPRQIKERQYVPQPELLTDASKLRTQRGNLIKQVTATAKHPFELRLVSERIRQEVVFVKECFF